MKFFQRILLGAALFLGLSAQAYLPGSSFPTPTLDYNFTASSFYQPATPACVSAATCLTTTRSTTAYADDLDGLWSLFAINTPRITNKGLLVEEARTNSIRNSAAGGSAVGTPGTAPTNWIITTYAGIASSVIGSGVDPTGVDYVDIRWNGTAGSTVVGGRIIDFDSRTQIAAVNGQTWTGRPFLRLVGGSLTGVALISAVSEFNNVGTFLTSSSTGTVPLTSGWVTPSVTRTNNNASTAFEGLLIGASWTNGAAVDFTLRIGWPQLELGAYSTSPIRTTTVAVTRSGDDVAVTTAPTFGTAYSQFVSATPISPITVAFSQALMEISDGTANNLMRTQRVATTGNPSVAVTSGGTTRNAQVTDVWGQAVSGKFAAGVADLNAASIFNGGTIAVPSPQNSLPIGVNSIKLGIRNSGAGAFNGLIQRATIWNSRLSNEQLRRLTAP